MAVQPRRTRFRLLVRALAAVACVLASPAAGEEEEPAPWYAGRLRVGTGVDFQTGDFGRATGDTDVLVVPVSLDYAFRELVFSERDRLRVRVSLPYLRFSGPDRGENTAFGVPAAAGVDSGLGDLNLRVGYLFTPPWDPWSGVEVLGRVKFPLAKRSSGLGTGEFDYLIGGRVHRTFRPLSWLRVTPSGSFGYKWVGDPPGAPRIDTWRAGGGVSFRIDRRYTLGVRYRWRESSVPNRGDRQELLVSTTLRLGRYRISPYALAGLSTRAADYGVGLRLSADLRFD